MPQRGSGARRSTSRAWARASRIWSRPRAARRSSRTPRREPRSITSPTVSQIHVSRREVLARASGTTQAAGRGRRTRAARSPSSRTWVRGSASRRIFTLSESDVCDTEERVETGVRVGGLYLELFENDRCRAVVFQWRCLVSNTSPSLFRVGRARGQTLSLSLSLETTSRDIYIYASFSRATHANRCTVFAGWVRLLLEGAARPLKTSLTFPRRPSLFLRSPRGRRSRRRTGLSSREPPQRQPPLFKGETTPRGALSLHRSVFAFQRWVHATHNNTPYFKARRVRARDRVESRQRHAPARRPTGQVASRCGPTAPGHAARRQLAPAAMLSTQSPRARRPDLRRHRARGEMRQLRRTCFASHLSARLGPRNVKIQRHAPIFLEESPQTPPHTRGPWTAHDNIRYSYSSVLASARS